MNLRVSRETGTPWIRRRSGGGTVYHVRVRRPYGCWPCLILSMLQDLGNTNYSIHLHRTAFDRRDTAQVALRAVRSLGVDANVNERNDICVGADKICPRRLARR